MRRRRLRVRLAILTMVIPRTASPPQRKERMCDLFILLRYREFADQFCQEGNSVRDAVDQDAFVRRVGAFTHGADPVERGNPKCRREVAVRSAAGGRFFEFYQAPTASLRANLQWRDSCLWAAPSGGQVGAITAGRIRRVHRLSNGLRARNLRSRAPASTRRKELESRFQPEALRLRSR